MGPHQDSERTPLLDERGIRMLQRLREHPDAPRWNYAVGDRLVAADLPRIEAFRRSLALGSEPRAPSHPPACVLDRIESLRTSVPWWIARLPRWLDLAGQWELIPTSCRRDLAVAPWDFVPAAEDLERLVIYRTAGTTGHPVQIPQHPLAVACYLPLVERALAAHGVALELDGGTVAAVLVGAQIKTYTYSTVLYGWGGAGFAKVNLRPSEWRRPDCRHRYLESLSPQLLTGEPIAFSEMLASGLTPPVRALLSTSIAMSSSCKARLAQAFRVPVVDWYSLVETGPIAYSCPQGHGMHVLPHDLHVEVLNPYGSVARPMERGEVTVSGGRNPYLPLLRYRTGDFARMSFQPCPCGDARPRLMDLEGRAPVLFRAADGTPVGSVDLSRLLREYPLLQHRFRQDERKSCTLWAVPLPGAVGLDELDLGRALRSLFGDLPIEVHLVGQLGQGDAKVVAYESALDPEAIT